MRMPSWRRFAGVVLICLAVSTQVLFQPGIFTYWSPALLLQGWLYFFGEVLLCGMAMWVCLVATERRFPEAMEFPVMAGAVLAGAIAGESASVVLLQPAGFKPPLLLILGDALRWALMGGIVAFIDAHLRRATSAGRALSEAQAQSLAIEREVLDARLELLQAQIEPHFLFNVLAHVKRLYRHDAAGGAEMLSNLRRYMESAIPHMRRPSSTLDAEIDLVRAYLHLIGARLGARLTYTFDIPAEARGRSFPPMILLTLVENSVKHGISPRLEGGSIGISAHLDDGRLRVEVADTGAGFTSSSGSGVGLANVQARLKALHGELGTLSMEENQPRGVVAQVVVPA